MSRFLRRTPADRDPDPETEAESRAAPRRRPPASARKRLERAKADPPATAKPAARRSPAQPVSRQTARNHEAGPPDQTALLEALDKQARLIGEQQQAIAKLAESQARLTEALLAEAGGEAGAKARVEVLPRLAIFVDVPNILYAAEASGVKLDWGKVADFLSRGRTLVRAIAYAPISDDPQARTENERFVVPFIDHGYRIATKPLKRFTGGTVKANFDVELAIDVLTMADRIDVIVLVSGDGDFRRLVEIVGSRGVRVEVMAFGQSTSSNLRQVADRYVDIAAHIPALSA